MISLEYIRANPNLFDHELAKRHLEPMSDKILELDLNLRTALTKTQSLNKRKNEITKLSANLRKNSKEIPIQLINESNEIKTLLPQLRALEDKFETELRDCLSNIPNLPDHTTPTGKSSEDNVEIRKHGTPPELVNPLAHDELGIDLGLMDFDTASNVSGSRFVYLYGKLAKLERALVQFMLDTHTKEHNFIEVNPPLMVKNTALYGTGQLPKFEQDLFKTGEHYLIPTSEVSLTNIVAGKFLLEDEMPL